MTAAGEERPDDIPIYFSDCRRLHEMTAWRPWRDAPTILEETREWINSNEAARAAVALG